MCFCSRFIVATVDGAISKKTNLPHTFRPVCTLLVIAARSLILGGDNLMRARKHFSQSVDLLKSGNARGLHGLCQACTSLATCKVCA